jgi:hypothetical protein
MAETPRLTGYTGFESKSGVKYVNQHVRVKLEFFPQDKNPFFPNRTTRKRLAYWGNDSEATVTAFNWQKQIGQASGQWNAALKIGPNSSLDLENGDVHDGDWVRCTIARNGVQIPLFLGVVDTVRRAKSSAGGATVKSWTLTGRDHGAPFDTPIAWASLYVQTIGQLFKGLYTAAVRGEVGGSPDKMFKLLIDAAFEQGTAGTKNKSHWALPPALEGEYRGKDIFRKLLYVSAGETVGAFQNEIQLWTQAGQSLWATLMSWCNPLLNEIWLDYANIKPILMQPEAIIRERPFINTIDGDESPWFSLPRFKVPNWLIENEDIGRGGAERFNLFEVTADFAFGNGQEQTALASPLIDLEGMVRYGIRPYQQSTKYINPGYVEQGAWPEEVGRWMRKLVDFYGPNPYWLNGQIATGACFPEIKIGNVLTVDSGKEDKNTHYYVEGTGLNYRYSARGAAARSNFVLTRGYNGTIRDGYYIVHENSKRFKSLF